MVSRWVDAHARSSATAAASRDSGAPLTPNGTLPLANRTVDRG